MALTYDHAYTDTIAAIATAMSEAGIGISVRRCTAQREKRERISLSGDRERSVTDIS